MGTKSSYNKQAKWINDYEATINIPPYQFEAITMEEIAQTISKFSNWKSPGVDNIQNYWWNSFKKIRPKLLTIYNQIVDNPESSPDWFVTGRTSLIPKKKETEIPSNYRPITCLPITYKILSSIMTKRIKHHLETYELIPEEQKGGVSEKQGTIDQLLIDSMVLDHAKKNKRNLSTAWIDYRKAFDSIPHDWLEKSLKIHKFPPKITNFISSLMKKWKTSLNISAQDKSISTSLIEILNGLFQGDCPSGLLFILCLLPLSWLINTSKIGYSIGRRNCRTLISHLLFMDDIKLYANNMKQLRNLLEIVSKFSDDIKMNFGLDKCNILNIQKGKLIPTDDIILSSEETIKALDIKDHYKYLGMLQSNEVNKKTMRNKYRDEYFNRISKILKTSLNSKNTIQAINTFAVPAISYGFQVLDWSITELEDIDRQTRNVLRKNHMLHNISDVDRLYVSRKNGGRGLLNITDLYKSQIITYCQYLQQSTEKLMLLVSTWQSERGTKSIHQKALQYMQELQIQPDNLHQLTRSQLKTNIKNKRSIKKSPPSKKRECMANILRL